MKILKSDSTGLRDFGILIVILLLCSCDPLGATELNTPAQPTTFQE